MQSLRVKNTKLEILQNVGSGLSPKPVSITDMINCLHHLWGWCVWSWEQHGINNVHDSIAGHDVSSDHSSWASSSWHDLDLHSVNLDSEWAHDGSLEHLSVHQGAGWVETWHHVVTDNSLQELGLAQQISSSGVQSSNEGLECRVCWSEHSDVGAWIGQSINKSGSLHSNAHYEFDNQPGDSNGEQLETEWWARPS